MICSYSLAKDIIPNVALMIHIKAVVLQEAPGFGEVQTFPLKQQASENDDLIVQRNSHETKIIDTKSKMIDTKSKIIDTKSKIIDTKKENNRHQKQNNKHNKQNNRHKKQNNRHKKRK